MIVLLLTIPALWVALFWTLLLGMMQAKLQRFTAQLISGIMSLVKRFIRAIKVRIASVADFVSEAVSRSLYLTTKWTICAHVVAGCAILGLALLTSLQALDAPGLHPADREALLGGHTSLEALDTETTRLRSQNAAVLEALRGLDRKYLGEFTGVVVTCLDNLDVQGRDSQSPYAERPLPDDPASLQDDDVQDPDFAAVPPEVTATLLAGLRDLKAHPRRKSLLPKLNNCLDLHLPVAISPDQAAALLDAIQGLDADSSTKSKRARQRPRPRPPPPVPRDLKDLGIALAVSACALGLLAEPSWWSRLVLMAPLLVGVGFFGSGYSIQHQQQQERSGRGAAAHLQPLQQPHPGLGINQLRVIVFLFTAALLVVRTSRVLARSVVLPVYYGSSLLLWLVLAPLLHALFGLSTVRLGMLAFGYWVLGVLLALYQHNFVLLGTCLLVLAFTLQYHGSASHLVHAGLRYWYLDELLYEPLVFVFRLGVLGARWLAHKVGRWAVTIPVVGGLVETMRPVINVISRLGLVWEQVSRLSQALAGVA